MVADPGSTYFLMAARSIVGWKYWAKCQVWPLRGCGLPRMLAEMTPMRRVLGADSVASARAATRADGVAASSCRRVGRGCGCMGMAVLLALCRLAVVILRRTSH